MYDCQRRFLYLIIIIYLIIYISARVIYIGARVIYIGSHWGAGTCPDATMRARHARAAGRPAAARARRAEGLSGANTAKNRVAVWVFQILCLPLPDTEEAPAPANAISKSVEVPTAAVRRLCRRLGLCTRVAGAMHHGGRDYAPGRRDYAPGRRDYAPGHRDYAPGRRDYAPGRREQEQRTKDIYNIIRYASTNRQHE